MRKGKTGSKAKSPVKAPTRAGKNTAARKAVPAAKTATAAKAGAKSSPAKSAAKPQKAVVPAVAVPKVKAATKAAAKSSNSTKKEKPQGGGEKKQPAEIVLDPSYRPSEHEPFMNEKQRVYFRNKLKSWKEDIIRQTRETLAGLHEDSTQHADLADRATSETDRALELRARDRQRKLIAKIDAALARIEDGSYGYCEETGEPIGLKRLDARPIATLSVEAQERHERREKVYRED